MHWRRTSTVRGVATRICWIRLLHLLRWSKKLNSTKGGADFPLVTLSTVFYPSNSLFHQLPRTRNQNAVNLVVELIYMLLHERVTIYRQSGVATVYHMHCSRTRILLPSIRIIKCSSLILFSNAYLTAVNQNIQSLSWSTRCLWLILFAPAMPNMTTTSSSEGPKRSFLSYFNRDT